MTAGGSTFTGSVNESITSGGATVNTGTITINKDTAAWAGSGMTVKLYNGTTATSYSATVSGSTASTATFNTIPNGTVALGAKAYW